MSPRTGRPTKSEQKRDKGIHLRLTEQELKDIDIVAKKENKTRADAIVYAIGRLIDSYEE